MPKARCSQRVSGRTMGKKRPNKLSQKMGADEPVRDYLERGPSHEIDAAAEHTLSATIPVHWSMNKQTSDYGKDYHVELFQKTPPKKITGKAFYIQLKGTKHADIRLKGTVVAYEFERRHLNHYCDDVI